MMGVSIHSFKDPIGQSESPDLIYMSKEPDIKGGLRNSPTVE